MNFFKNFQENKLIIAHRGFKGINNENSLEAFNNALDKCSFIEFDVQFTKDYIPVIHHDSTLKRLSNINKFNEYKDLEPWYIKDLTFEQIEKLKFNGKKILTLKEFLVFAKEKDIFFNLEIKNISNKLDSNRCLEIIYDLLKNIKVQEKVLISSFNHSYLKYFYQKDKNITLSALDEKIKRENLLEYLKKLNVKSYHIDQTIVDKNSIKILKEQGINTLVFTVNNKKEIDNLFKIGVKGVYTDFPYN